MVGCTIYITQSYLFGQGVVKPDFCTVLLLCQLFVPYIVRWCHFVEMVVLLWENMEGHYKSMHILNNFF